MKRLLLIALVLFCLPADLWQAGVAPVLAAPPYSGNGPTYSMMTWWFNTTDPADTFWFPGQEVQDVSSGGDSINIPITTGMDLLPYNYIGIEVAIIVPDTTLNDSLLTSLWTSYYGHGDSVIEAVAYTQITNGALFDTCIDFPDCPKAIKWTCIRDTTESPEYWWQRYLWVRLITYMTAAFRTDTTFTGEADTDGDLWAADGDSLLDWNSIGADGYFWDMLVEAEYDSFVYVHGKDSLFAVAMDAMAIAESPGTIDSVTFSVAYCESVVTVAEDSLRLGIAFGDSTGHHYDSLDIGLGGSGVLWATQQALDSSLSASTDPRAKDTVEFTFTTDPHGNVWTRTSLDSCILIFDPVHVDTSAGDDEVLGFLYIYRTFATVYHSRTELFPKVKGRVTVYLKE